MIFAVEIKGYFLKLKQTDSQLLGKLRGRTIGIYSVFVEDLAMNNVLDLGAFCRYRTSIS